MSTISNSTNSNPMTRIENDSIDILIERTLDVLVVAGWLIRVSVKEENCNSNDVKEENSNANDAHDNDGGKAGIQLRKENDDSLFQLFMATDATVHDVKVVTSMHTKIAPKEIRFINEVTGRPVYYGPLVPTVISSSPIENVNMKYF